MPVNQNKKQNHSNNKCIMQKIAKNLQMPIARLVIFKIYKKSIVKSFWCNELLKIICIIKIDLLFIYKYFPNNKLDTTWYVCNLKTKNFRT